MGFDFFTNGLHNGMYPQPNEEYREMQQAFIDQQWDNTSARRTIKEQDDIGSESYHEIEVWINKAIGLTTTFAKTGEDYRQLMFRNIDKKTVRGLYYQFENRWWICDFENPDEGLGVGISVRRCNNWLKMIDPENGSVFSIPCVVDYDMTSPTVQVNSKIITPNNHAVVYVQGNTDTLRLFKLNTRFMLRGRPFKLNAFQDALLLDNDNPVPTLLTLDLYLDELHAQDSIEQQLAYNGTFDYNVVIQSEDLTLTHGATGTLVADMSLNGKNVERPVVWKSSDCKAVQIDKYTGEYEVVGELGSQVQIQVWLDGNPNVKDEITITIADEQSIQAVVYLSPVIEKIRQYESIDFTVEAAYGGTVYQGDSLSQISVSLNETEEVLSNDYVTITVLGDNQYRLTCTKFSQETPQTLYVSATCENPAFTGKAIVEVNTVSMLG